MTNNYDPNAPIAPEVPEKLPNYYEIIVDVAGEELTYPQVEAFKIEDRMLQFLHQGSTVIIPISDNVTSIEITPVYLEEKRIVQVP